MNFLTKLKHSKNLTVYNLQIRNRFLTFFVLIIFVGSFTVKGFSQDTRLTNPLMPMTHCLESPHRDQPALLKSLGYDGLYYAASNVGQIPVVLDSLKKYDLAMMGVYAAGNSANLGTIISHIEGATQITLHFPSNFYSSDSQVIEDLTKASTLTQPKNIKLVIYPHFGFYIETLEKAVEIIKKSNLENIGVMFNLNHSIRVQHRLGNHFNSTVMPVVQANIDYIVSMTVVGADSNGEAGLPSGRDFKKILGTGNYNTFEFVNNVLDWGYSGPFTIQCYGVQGDKNQNLQHNFDVWKVWQDSLSPLTSVFSNHTNTTTSLILKGKYYYQNPGMLRDVSGKAVWFENSK